MNLLEKQQTFAWTLARFLIDLHKRDYKLTLGQVYRDTDTARIYASQGKGIVDSLHCLKLAVDINLFKNSVYLTNCDDYLEAGELWESYSTAEIECCWGGRFESKDGNHFSVGHAGRK